VSGPICLLEKASTWRGTVAKRLLMSATPFARSIFSPAQKVFPARFVVGETFVVFES
jgi:hypothetical protein